MAEKFTGVLLCSDFDGTICPDGKNISPENLAALRYFEENGGLFTMASGRYPSHFLSTNPPMPINTYAICVNGNLVWDLAGNREMWSSPIPDDKVREVVHYLCAELPLWDSLHVCAATDGSIMKRGDSEEEFFARIFGDEKLHPALKIMAVKHGGITPDFRLPFEARFPELPFCMSWSEGIELNMPSGGKGNGARALRELLGGRDVIHTVVGAGDFENDLTLIEYADIGYAVGNAADAIKARADRVTRACREHAIAAIIEDLDREF